MVKEVKEGFPPIVSQVIFSYKTFFHLEVKETVIKVKEVKDR